MVDMVALLLVASLVWTGSCSLAMLFGSLMERPELPAPDFSRPPEGLDPSQLENGYLIWFRDVGMLPWAAAEWQARLDHHHREVARAEREKAQRALGDELLRESEEWFGICSRSG